MRQDHRTPFDRALHRVRATAYGPGEFVGQEGFMTAGEIRALAARAGIGPGVGVLDVGCGIAGPGRLLTRELGCGYLGVDFSASAVAIAREQAGDLPCRFAVAHAPPLPAGRFDVVLLLEAMLAVEDKDALVAAVAAALGPGGRFAFTLEEGLPLTAAERAAMPDPDTVWLTPLDELTASLERAGLVVTWQADHSRAHRATAQALADAYAADAAAISRADRPPGAGRPARRPPAVGRVAGHGAGPQARAGGRSEVERQLGAGPRAADEHAALGRRLERLDVVADVAGEQAALAVVADAVAAAEADRHVAGLGEVEQARVAVVPRHGEVAARERDDRPGARRAGGSVRGPVAGAHDARAVDGDGAEGLRRDPVGRHAAGGERGADRPHERLRPAEVVVGVDRDAQPVEQRAVEPAGAGPPPAGRL